MLKRFHGTVRNGKIEVDMPERLREGAAVGVVVFEMEEPGSVAPEAMAAAQDDFAIAEILASRHGGTPALAK